MCGIFGVLKTGPAISPDDLEKVAGASHLMKRRGPDDQGVWSNQHTALAFRRLAILDLSPAGHQPMVSADGTCALIFNGEIYNYLEIRDQLSAKGYTFRSRSDTEVLLYALMEWGADALKRCNGMFALAFWDGRKQTVLIARDHVGMKPLYYSHHNGSFIFGSQLNQLLLFVPREDRTLDRKGLAFFLSVGYYPSPRTVFQEINQVEPGEWIQVNVKGEVVRGLHFDLLQFFRNNRSNETSTDILREKLSQSVKRHLMSDVPLGTFLSGGLDSGIITAFTQQHLGKDFVAFTLSNPGTRFDESERATEVARSLDIPHRIVEPNNILEVIRNFSDAYQEPFGDYSALPALLVTAEARKEIKVMLSGDGSDEFFFGYNRMTSMLQSSRLYHYPYFVRRLLKKVNPSLPALTFKNLPDMIFARQSFSTQEVFSNLGLKREELAEEFLLPKGAGDDLPSDMVIKLNAIYRYFQLQLLKLDRASMYHSVEARVPFADKELLRHTIGYTAMQTTSNNYAQRKLPLVEIYKGLFPDLPLHEGPKKGFTIDMESMLTAELKEYGQDLLRTETIFSGPVDFQSARERKAGDEGSAFNNWFLISLQTWALRYN